MPKDLRITFKLELVFRAEAWEADGYPLTVEGALERLQEELEAGTKAEGLYDYPEVLEVTRVVEQDPELD